MTNQSELFNDRLLRYETLANVRKSKKQKDKFLSILLKEVISFREDISIKEYQDKEIKVGKNVYVGDIENAPLIIATYYDTPSNFIGNYYFNNTKINSKNTVNRIIIESILYLLIGIVIFVFIQNIFDGQVNQLYWIVVALYTFLYFLIFKFITSGRSQKRNLIRNTSTIVQILNLMETYESKELAFAFVDNGCNSELGLVALRKINNNATIIYLDSINTENEILINIDGLWQKWNGIINFKNKKLYRIVSGKIDGNNEVYLDQKTLNSNEFSDKNFNLIRNEICEKEI